MGQDVSVGHGKHYFVGQGSKKKFQESRDHVEQRGAEKGHVTSVALL
jgi:hypothetical protein